MTNELVVRRLAATFGLAERSTWPRELASALAYVAKRRALDRAGLTRELLTDVDLLREIAGHLTIDESHFLRHPRHFELLLERLQRLHRQQPSGERLRIWSAGCAKGEEPYSVALLAKECFGEQWAGRIEIFANDINREALEHARRAIFSPWSFRGVPDAVVRRHFTLTEAGHFALAPSIAAPVTFEHVSIQEHLEQMPASPVDVVLFRNVAIYLAPEATREIYAGLHAALRPGGLLLVAPADPTPPRELFERSDEDVAGAFVRCAEQQRTSPEQRLGGHPFLQLHFQAAARDSAHTRRTPAVVPADCRPVTKDRAVQESAQTSGPVEAEEQHRVLEHQLATRLIATSPMAPQGYLLRGRLLLAEQRASDAVRDFRRALFLGGDNRIARFWYAAALQCAGRPGKARSQAAQLAVQLAALPEDEILEDGQTLAAALLGAVALMQTSLQ